MHDAVKRQFPDADHQQCWVHLSRTVARYVRNKDRKEVLDDLKSVYNSDSDKAAKGALAAFLKKYGKCYPRLTGIFERAEDSLYNFYKYPEAIRKSIYTTNIIERSNKGLKHKSKVKEQFPNEKSLERFVCCYYSDLNRSYADRIQKGFRQASSEIIQMFESRKEANSNQEAA